VSEVGESEDQPLVLDELGERLERFTALRDTDSAAADAVLDELGGTSDVDRDILAELAGRTPLAYPDRFGEAHALAMRALEVLDRNGARRVRVPQAGPLRPIAEPVVQLVTRAIVRSYQSTVIDRLRDLYSRRLAWCPPDDPSRMTLVRARLDSQRATSAYKHKGGGLPTFIVGGAERPLAALYETIGRCGRPPRDNARTVALYAILLTVIAGLVVPAGVVYVTTRL
jgi:hypothetical protein